MESLRIIIPKYAIIGVYRDYNPYIVKNRVELGLLS